MAITSTPATSTPATSTSRSRTQSRTQSPAGKGVTAAVLALLERSRTSLESACRTGDATERYLDAHLGALRAAAALIATRQPPTARYRPRSVWVSLPLLAPELAEWADFFAESGSQRSIIDRGGWVSIRDADDLLRQAEMFLEIVQDLLGIPQTIPLPDSITPVSVAKPLAAQELSMLRSGRAAGA